MKHSETIRALLARLHAAGGADFVEDPPGTGVYEWISRFGRWPLVIQVDRWALEIRCYTGDELVCTGRLPEVEAEALLQARTGQGDPEARRQMTEFLDSIITGDSRRFLAPPHADRHPDRRPDPRHERTIRALPSREIEKPT